MRWFQGSAEVLLHQTSWCTGNRDSAVFHTWLPSWPEEERSTEECALKCFMSWAESGIHSLAASAQPHSHVWVQGSLGKEEEAQIFRNLCINLVVKICLHPSSHIQNSFKPFPRGPTPSFIRLSLGSGWSLFFSIHLDVARHHPAACKLNAVVEQAESNPSATALKRETYRGKYQETNSNHHPQQEWTPTGPASWKKGLD